MKILSIAGRNLNSLRVDFKVDFTAGVLKDCGIFAITGPTGAGKTTLLDAITLALYGKTPRSASDEDIISYGAGEAWAEVVFQTAEGQFKSEWKVRRARSRHDGAMQQSVMEVSTFPQGKILTQKKREAQDKVRELIKLEYDQFLKSVLLAQGAFKAFLDARESERGEMLEKISDTSLYTKLSKRAFDRKRKEEQVLEGLKDKVGNVVTLSEQERSACINNINQLKSEEQEQQKSLADLLLKFNWLQMIADLESKQQLAEQDVNLAKEKMEAEQSNLQRWERHQQIAALESDWIQYLSRLKDIDSQQQNIQTLETRLASLTEKTGLADSTLKNSVEKTEIATKKREEKMPAILEAITRKKDMLTEKKQLDEIIIKRQAKILEGTACSTKISDNQNALAKNQKKLDELEGWLHQNKVYAEAGNSYTDAYLLVSKLKRTTEDIEQHETALKKNNDQLSLAHKEIIASEASEKEATNEQLSINQLKSAASQQLNKLKSQLLHHLQKNNSLLDNTTLLRGVKQNELSRQEFLAEHLSMLHEGEPCPLCGSAEHPNQTLSIIDVQQEIVNIKAALKQDQDFIKTYGDQQKTVEKLLANLDDYAESAEPDEEELPENFEKIFNGLTHAQKALPKKESDAVLKLAAARQLKESLRAKVISLETDKNGWSTNLMFCKETYKEQVDNLQKIAEQFMLPFDLEHPAKLTHALKQFSEEHLRNSKDQSALKGTIPGMIESIETLRSQIQGLRRDVVQLQEGIDQKNKVIKEYSEAIILTLGGHDSPEAAREKLIADEKTAREQVNRFQDNLNSLRKETGEISGQKNSAEIALKDLLAAVETLSGNLEAALLEAGWEADLELVRQNLLNSKDRVLLEKLHRFLHEKLVLSLAHLESCRVQLDSQRALEITTEDADSINEKMQKVREAMQEMNRELGSLGQILKDDDEKQLKLQKVKKEIETQQKVLEKWKSLSDLIGSADGKKFNQFAQGLTLDRLIVISNHHLQLLNDRYLLKRNINEQGLGLLIIDQYQADNEREINTLSGGESFLVSLALALGLSEMTSKLTTIDSLFIDEGFGTLDADTLEVALSALRGLQIGGKTIGIISHVERLKEEIYTQVEITKGSDGFSTIRVVPEIF